MFISDLILLWDLLVFLIVCKFLQILLFLPYRLITRAKHRRYRKTS